MLLLFQLTWDQDAAAAALFTACKIEDTLKKSRDIICAAHNLRLPVNEHLSPDDSVSSFLKLAALDSFRGADFRDSFTSHNRAGKADVRSL